MELIDKANILSEFYSLHDDDSWIEFFDTYNEGIVLGSLLSSGHIMQLNADGERSIDDAYTALLNEWGVVDAEYSSLTSLIAGQPNEENA